MVETEQLHSKRGLEELIHDLEKLKEKDIGQEESVLFLQKALQFSFIELSSSNIDEILAASLLSKFTHLFSRTPSSSAIPFPPGSNQAAMVEAQLYFCQFLQKFIKETKRIQEIFNENLISAFLHQLRDEIVPHLSIEEDGKEAEDNSRLLPPLEQEMFKVIGLVCIEGSYYHICPLVHQGIIPLCCRLVFHSRCDVENLLLITAMFGQMITIAVRCQHYDQGMLINLLRNVGLLSTLSALKEKVSDDSSADPRKESIQRNIQDAVDILAFSSRLVIKHTGNRK